MDVREYVGEREALGNAAEHGLKLTVLLIKNGTASMIILSHACLVSGILVNNMLF